MTVAEEFSSAASADLQKEGVSKEMVEQMRDAISKGNASKLLKVMHEKDSIDRRNHESSKEYLGAVQNFSSKIDSLNVNNNVQNQVSAKAAAIGIDKDNKKLQESKVERDMLSAQIERTSDPVARSQLQNQLSMKQSATENMAASLAAKQSVLATGGSGDAGKQ
jgi:hypothetical protein